MCGTTTGRSRSISEAVTDAVATREGVDAVDLVTPLYDAIDPESLDRLLDDDRETPIRVTFSYYGYEVTVDSEDAVTLAD